MKRKFISQAILNAVFIILCACIIIPFLIIVAVSLSSESDIAKYGYSLFVRNIDFTAYKYVLSNPKDIIDAYKVTIIFSVIGTFLGVLLMAMAAYPLSRSNMKFKNGISFYFYFTMLFGGGLVPTYILITQYLHLGNSIWVYIIPSLINVWYVFMMRTSFMTIPQTIIESACIDGASEYAIFFKFIIPLSKPIIATIALFTFLGKWNDWYTCMLYINDKELQSLQYMLQKIIMNIQEMLNNRDVVNINIEEVPSETARMATAILVAGPALVIFPFFQKYFVKGITVGSVKG